MPSETSLRGARESPGNSRARVGSLYLSRGVCRSPGPAWWPADWPDWFCFAIEARRLGQIGIAVLVAAEPYVVLPASTVAAQIAIAAGPLTMFPTTPWALRFATPGKLRNAQADVQAAVRRLRSDPVCSATDS